MTSVARNLMRASLYGSHPYGLRNSGTPESVGRLDRDAMLDFFRKFVTGKNAVIAVFGNVKAEEVKALFERNSENFPPASPPWPASPSRKP